jgi:hypothetical protein
MLPTETRLLEKVNDSAVAKRLIPIIPNPPTARVIRAQMTNEVKSLIDNLD